MNLAQAVKEARRVQAEDFIQQMEEATQLLSKENGQVGNFNVTGRLVEIKPLGKAVIVSDLHGDLESLIQIVKGSGFPQKIDSNRDVLMVFLGDYGDRGIYSVEVYYVILKLKLLFPEHVILMRGNHEGPEDIMASPHDLPMQFHRRFGKKWAEAYSKTRELFRNLYNAVLVEELCLMIHGGLPLKARTLEDLAFAHTLHPKQRLFEEMLWNDPTEVIKGSCDSPRGAGKLFGENITKEVLRRFDVKLLIRGHEPCRDGFKINHNGKVLTLFSRKGSPYFNPKGAYLNVELSRKVDNANHLVPFVHIF